VSRRELLPPELLDGLRDLDWVARMVARGLGAGLHRSPRAGLGEEFERHRPYQQGDDLRHLDWRVMARSDRLQVRRFRETANLGAMLVVDASASMDFAGNGAGAGVTKARYAVLLAAALGHLLLQGGDRVGVAVLDASGAGVRVPPGEGRGARGRLLHALESVTPGGRGSLAPLVERAAAQLRGRGRVVVLGDLLEEDGGEVLAAALGRVAGAGHEVEVIRILTPEELGEGAGGEGLYLDPERRDRAVPGSPATDPGYRERLQAYYGGLREALEDTGIRWREARTDDPLLPLLRSWLRSGLRGRLP
jgi:uncharacterized protein (DUF58 family)